MGFNLDEIKEFALSGIDATWLDHATKRQWRREWSAEIDTLIAQT
jgi:hypothetical protein